MVVTDPVVRAATEPSALVAEIVFDSLRSRGRISREFGVCGHIDFVRYSEEWLILWVARFRERVFR